MDNLTTPTTVKDFRFINVIARPQVYNIYRRVIRSEQLLLIHGNVQRERNVINVIAQRISCMGLA